MSRPPGSLTIRLAELRPVVDAVELTKALRGRMVGGKLRSARLVPVDGGMTVELFGSSTFVPVATGALDCDLVVDANLLAGFLSNSTRAFHPAEIVSLRLSRRGRIQPRDLRLLTFGWIALALFGLTLATGIFAFGPGVEPDWTGVACAIGAAVLYAFVTIIAKGFPRSNGAQLTLVQCLCGVLVFAAWLPLPPQSLSAVQSGWLALIGGVHTCAVYILLYNALPKLPTASAAVLLFLYPISAIVVDAIYYGHAITALQAMGFICVLLASLGITLKWGTSLRRPGYACR